MSSFEVVGPEFASFVLGNAPVKQLATGFDGTESRVWFGDANCLLFSDIPKQPDHARDAGGGGERFFANHGYREAYAAIWGQVAPIADIQKGKGRFCALFFSGMKIRRRCGSEMGEAHETWIQAADRRGGSQD